MWDAEQILFVSQKQETWCFVITLAKCYYQTTEFYVLYKMLRMLIQFWSVTFYSYINGSCLSRHRLRELKWSRPRIYCAVKLETQTNEKRKIGSEMFRDKANWHSKFRENYRAIFYTYVFRWTPCGWRRWLCRQRDSISALWLRPLRRPQSRCEGRSVSSTCDLDGEQSTLINQLTSKHPAVLKNILNHVRFLTDFRMHDFRQGVFYML